MRFNLINNIEKEVNWNVTLSMAHERDKIRKISNAMKAMNEEALKLETIQTLLRYSKCMK